MSFIRLIGWDLGQEELWHTYKGHHCLLARAAHMPHVCTVMIVFMVTCSRARQTGITLSMTEPRTWEVVCPCA